MRIVDQLVWSEALAFPLASLEAIEAGLIDLTRDNWGFLAGDTARLAEEFDEDAQRRFGRQGLTLEFIRTVRTQAWFGTGLAKESGRTKVRLDEFVGGLAEELLDVPNNFVVLKSPRPEPVKSCGSVRDLLEGGSDFWQRLGTIVCHDLLLAARAVGIDSGWPLLAQDRVVILDRGMGRRLPLVDQHLHLGACLPLSVLWVQALTARILRPPRAGERRDQESAFHFVRSGSPLDLRPLLLRAAAGRLAIAWFLTDRERGMAPPDPGFGEWLRRTAQRLSQDDANADFLWRVLRAEGTWLNAVSQARRPKGEWKLFARQCSRALGYLEGRVRGDLKDPQGRALPADPLGRMWRSRFAQSDSPTIEPELIGSGLKYIAQCAGDRNSPRDIPFETVFWQVLRVKNLFHQHLTQQEGVAGLTFFDHYYRRMGTFRADLRGRLISIAERHLNAEGDAKKLEFRVAPGKNLSETRNDLIGKLKDYRRALENAASSGRTPACIGLSIHFVKEWAAQGSGRPNSYPDKGDDPLVDRRRWRYFSYWRNVWRQMEGLTRLLLGAPALSFFARGIDVANRERSIPNWVFAHVFGEFRRRLSPAMRGWDAGGYRMRLTAHLGEEFEHPLTGLRHIWEGVRFFGYESGDRIGHGVALGLPLTEWAKEHEEAAVPVEEYLDDLVWESLLYEDAGLPDEGDRVRINSEIDAVARELYPDSQPQEVCARHRLAGTPAAPALREAYRDRFDSVQLRELGILALDPQTGWLKFPPRWDGFAYSTTTMDLLVAQLFCEKLWRRAQRIGNWRIRIDDWYLRRAERIQTWLRQWIGVRSVVVEACPSSNRLIGDLGWYENHPVFQFAPPSQPEAAEVSFTINSDDPLTFNTRIGAELDHLFRAMTERLNVSAALAERWIRDRCEMAWDTSFVVGRPNASLDVADRTQILEGIRKAIAQLSK